MTTRDGKRQHEPQPGALQHPADHGAPMDVGRIGPADPHADPAHAHQRDDDRGAGGEAEQDLQAVAGEPGGGIGPHPLGLEIEAVGAVHALRPLSWICAAACRERRSGRARRWTDIWSRAGRSSRAEPRPCRASPPRSAPGGHRICAPWSACCRALRRPAPATPSVRRRPRPRRRPASNAIALAPQVRKCLAVKSSPVASRI